MLRALAWKEWREQRPVILSGLVLAALLPLFLIAGASGMARSANLADLAGLLPAAYALLLWPLFAAAAGATTVAGEISDGTLGFLLSRPLTRARVWAVKTTVAAMGVALIAAGSALVALAFSRISGIRASMFAEAATAAASTAGFAFLTFACATFFSGIVSRTITAAAGGIAAALAILVGLSFVWSAVGLSPALEPGWIGLDMLLTGLAVLCGALYVFNRGEMLRGPGARRAALLATAGALLAIGVATIPLLYSSLRLTPKSATLRGLQLTPSGDSLVVAAYDTEKEGSLQVWRIPSDGGGMIRLTGRRTFFPAVAPDGESVAYLSQRGPLGLLAARDAELRLVRLDGTGDRPIASGMPPFSAFPTLTFSPDGNKIVVSDSTGGIAVASTADGPTARFDLKGTDLEGARMLGWSSDSSEVILIVSRPRDREPRITVGAYDPISNRVRVIVREDGSTLRFWHWGDGLIGDFVPLILAGRASTPSNRVPGDTWAHSLVLVDARDGSRRTITESACAPRTAPLDDGRRLAYTTCERIDAGASLTAEVRIRDLDTGEDRLFGEVEGAVASIRVSPDGSRVLMWGNEPGRNRTVILDREGAVREIGEMWIPLGWSGRDQILLIDRSRSPEQIVVANATGEIVREIYP